MTRSHVWRRAGVALGAMLVAGLIPLTAGPALAAADGPPHIESEARQSGPTSGGIAVRIYGTGFKGTTTVLFGSQPATFAVINSTLITAIVPPAAGGAAADNTFVDVKVIDDQGSDTLPQAFYYTNATITVSPSTGLHPGDPISVTVLGYAPKTNGVLPEVNPLQVYIQGGPPFPPGPPPYADPLAFPTTNRNGNIRDLLVHLSDPFNEDGQAYDPNAVCPVNQETANYLGNSASPSPYQLAYSGKCLIAFGQFGLGTIDTPFSFANDPTPAKPTLTLSTSSANQGTQVTLSGMFWNANPFFGSSRTAKRPGETKTTVEICGIGGDKTNCSQTMGNATVTPTQYINFVFSGATLSGQITVGSDIPNNCTTCFVRVRQFRPAGGSIQATAPLNVT